VERTGKRAIDNLTQFINEIQQSQVGQFYSERNLNYLERQQFLKLSHCHNDFLALNILSKAKTREETTGAREVWKAFYAREKAEGEVADRRCRTDFQW